MVQDALTQRRILWRLYHLANKISQSTQKVEEANNRLAEFRAACVNISIVNYHEWALTAM